MAISSESRLLVLLRLPLVLFAVGMMLARYGARFTRFAAKNWDVVLFILVPFSSVIFSPSKLFAIQYAVWFALSLLTVLCFVYLLGSRVPSKLWTEHVSWLLMAGYIVVAILVLFSLRSFFGGVLDSAYSHSNFYSFACALVFVVILVLDRQRRIPGNRLVNRIPYWALLTLGVVSLVPVLWSAKRAAVVAVGLALAVYVLANRSQPTGTRTSSLLRTALLATVFVAAAWMAFPRMDTTITRFERLIDPAVEDASIGVRQDIWRAGVDLVADESPFFGVGLANGRIAMEELSATEESAGMGLHSTYIAVFIEMGGIGVLIFVILCLRSLRLFVTCPASFKWNHTILSIPAVLICATEYNLIPGQAVFWPFWLALLLPRIGLVPSSDVDVGRRNDIRKKLGEYRT